MSKAQSPLKRLTRELQDLQDEPNDAVLRLGPVDDDLFHWHAVLKGPAGTAYEGGLWALSITIPPNYPNAPPKVRFETPICHPNVHFQTGEICLDLLKDKWAPTITISILLTSIQQLLTSAEPDSPLNVDIAQLFRQGDWAGAESLIRYYTQVERWDGR
ncbi:ubiquitin-conjugating enzyme [Trichodelitschia bisporula]|uniref:Ubiquitin-conjugating enzyme n=1 Tax=Trichodelitschia bisporula TaxID=703511 RepID=A0A6G1HLF8_9PEZI|nr:ubiquitin-conjugating enzyme [Trichodelitschia bisporula]